MRRKFNVLHRAAAAIAVMRASGCAPIGRRLDNLLNLCFGKMGFISSKFLRKYARIVIFLSFVVAAVISPTPDVFTQSMIAVPMIALYGVGYLIVRYILRK